MNRVKSNRIVLVLAGILAALISVILLWGYILSFQEVTFRYDPKLGYVELSDSQNTKLYPKNNQPVQLAKGEYHIQNIGKNIKPDYRKLVVTDNTTTINTSYSYTDAYLTKLLEKEQAAARAALYEAYPVAREAYRLRHEKLYELGTLYGAILVAKTTGDNSDTLRVLIEKRDGIWRVRSTPPVPLLSAPDYPRVDVRSLADINRAR